MGGMGGRVGPKTVTVFVSPHSLPTQSCQWQFVSDVIKCETASHIFLSVCDIDFCLISIKWRFVTVKVSVSCGYTVNSDIIFPTRPQTQST